MKRAVLPLLILVAVALAVGAAWFVLDRGFPGRGGELTATERPLAPFTKIAVDGLADVTLVQGAAESVRVEAPLKQLPHVRTEVRDGTLFIANEDSRNWWGFLFGGGPRSARVTVTFRELTGVRAAGAVKLKADGLKTDKLAITVSGAASLKIASLEANELSIAGSGAVKAEIAGRATEQKIKISGAGDYRGANLVSERASVAVSGAGKVFINATKTLKIGISGAGSVDYLGNPQVSEQISGAGRVKRRESAAPGQPAIA